MNQEQHAGIVARILIWFRDLLASADFQATEAQAAIVSVVLGVVLLNPFTVTFAGSGFAAMASIAPEWAWGLVLLWVGITDLIAMVRQSFRWRRAMLFVISCLWTFLSVMFSISSPNGWGIWLFGVLAVSAGWAYWRMALKK